MISDRGAPQLAMVRCSSPSDRPSAHPCARSPIWVRDATRTAEGFFRPRPAAGHGRPPTAQGSTVTLMAAPFLTIEKASSTFSRRMRWVMRSFTGTCPEEMYSSARLLCSGADPLAPWMCSWRRECGAFRLPKKYSGG